MDREVLKFSADIDQARAGARSAVEQMPSDNLVALFRDCAAGRLAGMDERTLLLVGMLAAMAIYDICQARSDEDDWSPPGPPCPRCGEDDIDSLVWIDDETVRCMNCGTKYQPSRFRKKGGEGDATGEL